MWCETENPQSSLEQGWEGAGPTSGRQGSYGAGRQGFLTRPAHAKVVQVLRPYKVKMFWPSDVEFLKDGPVELGQLDVPEQPKEPQGTGFREHVWG